MDAQLPSSSEVDQFLKDNQEPEEKSLWQTAPDEIMKNVTAASQAAENIPGVAQVAAATGATTSGLAPGFQGSWLERYDNIRAQQEEAAKKAKEEHPIGATFGEIATTAPLMAINPAAAVTGKIAPVARIAQGTAQGAGIGALTAGEGNRTKGAAIGAALGAAGTGLGEAAGALTRSFPGVANRLRVSAASPNSTMIKEMSHEQAMVINNPERLVKGIDNAIAENPEVFSNLTQTASKVPMTTRVEAKAMQLKDNVGHEIGNVIREVEANPVSSQVMASKTIPEIEEKFKIILAKTDDTRRAAVKEQLDHWRQDIAHNPTLEGLQEMKVSLNAEAKKKLYAVTPAKDDLSVAYRDVTEAIKTGIEGHISAVEPSMTGDITSLNKKYSQLRAIELAFNQATSKGPGLARSSAEIAGLLTSIVTMNPLPAVGSAVSHYAASSTGKLQISKALETAAQKAGVAHWNLLPAPVIAGIMNANK